MEPACAATWESAHPRCTTHTCTLTGNHPPPHLCRCTAQLIQEAAVAGFVNGTRHAQGRPWEEMRADFPRDHDILAEAFRTARDHPDLYPQLAKAAD